MEGGGAAAGGLERRAAAEQRCFSGESGADFPQPSLPGRLNGWLPLAEALPLCFRSARTPLESSCGSGRLRCPAVALQSGTAKDFAGEEGGREGECETEASAFLGWQGALGLLLSSVLPPGMCVLPPLNHSSQDKPSPPAAATKGECDFLKICISFYFCTGNEK